MKNWFSTLRTSATMDSKSGKRGLQSGSPAERELQEVHETLEHSLPAVPPPDDLHFTIMQAVRQNSGRQAEPTEARVVPLRRLAVAASCVCALLIFAGVVLSLAPREQPLETFAAVHSVVETAAANSSQIKLLSPLEDELQRVDAVLRNTANHLLSSVP